MDEFLSQTLADLKEKNLFRNLPNLDKPGLINFCSNDYLGISKHPKVIEACQEALKKYGHGAGASRLVSGNTILHEKLEQELADFKDREAAILFSSGYMANLGVLTALLDADDTVIIDKLSHASLVDAAKFSKAKLQVFAHSNMDALEKILKRSEKFKKRLIVTDSVFSMDGDIANLPEIVRLAKQYNALTLIDEAHATGVIGSRGKGLEEHFRLERQVDIVMGTLSKALGGLGGFVCGSQNLIDFLRNKARTFIYTTALPPAICAGVLQAVQIIKKDQTLINNLRDNISYFLGKTKNLRLMTYNLQLITPIIPIMIGDEKKALDLSAQLFQKGVLLTAIRPPTVPKGTSRLRITIQATHTKEEIECLKRFL